MGIVLSAIVCGLLVLFLLNRLSYSFLKRRIVKKRRWCLNICCGKTDGGGVNVDIVEHAALPNFRRISDVYHLPFEQNQFRWILCSHTVEHLDDPERFDRELRRVGQNVVYVLPPIWDIAAALNVFEHKWVFLTLRTEHSQLPKYVKLPLARTLQRLLGQKITA